MALTDAMIGQPHKPCDPGRLGIARVMDQHVDSVLSDLGEGRPDQRA